MNARRPRPLLSLVFFRATAVVEVKGVGHGRTSKQRDVLTDVDCVVIMATRQRIARIAVTIRFVVYCIIIVLVIRVVMVIAMMMRMIDRQMYVRPRRMVVRFSHTRPGM